MVFQNVANARINQLPPNMLGEPENNVNDQPLLPQNDRAQIANFRNRLRILQYFENLMRARRPRENIDINKLRRMTPEEKQNMVETSCTICISPLEENPEEPLIYLPCNQNHVFHEHCIISWLEENQNCPLCRELVTQAAVEAYARNDNLQ